MAEFAHKRHAYHLNRLVQRDTTETTTTCSGGLLGGFQNCVTRTITHKTTPTNPPNGPNPPPVSQPTSTRRSSTPPASSAPASSAPVDNNDPPSSSSRSSKAAVPSSTSKAPVSTKSSAQAAQVSSTAPPLDPNQSGSSVATLPSSTPAFLGNSGLPQSESSLSFTSDSSAPSSSTTSSSDSEASNPRTSAIVGGIVAGIAGIAVIALISMYFLRRWKQRQEDRDADEVFAAQYRRQSAILVEDEYSGDASGGMAGMIGAGGYKPRPPTMIERHLANGAGAGAGAVSFGQDQYGQHPNYPQGRAPAHFHEQSPTEQYYDTGTPGSFSVGDYATMDRGTGVTPLQAAQYAAIAEQIHSGQHYPQQGEYDPNAYYQQPAPGEQWNSGSHYEDGIHAPQAAAMAYDFPMTPNTHPSPDDVAIYQGRAQSPPSLGPRREPTAYNVSAPHRQNSTGHGY